MEKELKGISLVGLSQINRVQKNIEKISKKKECDEMVLNAALMLHNVGVKRHLEFHQNLMHSNLNLSKSFLKNNFFPMEKIDLVLHCIQEAHLRGKPKSIEAKLLHDAVLLDEIGTIGIVKDSFVLLKQKNSAKQLLEFLNAKNVLLKETFFTVKGKSLARERIAEFEKNVKGLEKELAN